MQIAASNIQIQLMKALNIYKPPFTAYSLYIFSDNDVMTLMGSDDVSEEAMSRLSEILNGNAKPNKVNEYQYVGGEIWCNGKLMFIVRGWGHLTGSAGLNLSETEAEKIQDEFGRWVISKLTNTD